MVDETGGERTQIRSTLPPLFLVFRPTLANVGAKLRIGPSRMDEAIAGLYPGKCADWMRTSSEIGSSIGDELLARCLKYS